MPSSPASTGVWPAPATHLLLVSAQPTPNLTPALDPATRPRRAVLLQSPDMARQAEALAAVLERRGVRVERWPIEDAWDLEHVQFRVLELLDAEREAAGGIALNVTGGTKPMAIAAFDAFRAYGLPIYYVHPEQDRLIWMHPADWPNVALANRVRLDDFLAVHGARLIARDEAVPSEQRQLADWLVAQNTRIARALTTLNWLASKAEGGLVSPELASDQMQDAALGELLGRCRDAGLLEIDGHRVRFADEAARVYLNGGWLEAHVYQVLRALRPELGQIQDLARNVEIAREGGRGGAIRNELDVACPAENRLYVIECKTARPRADGRGGPGPEALYKLDTLRDLLGGLQARAMLVSYAELPGHILRRAADLRIQVCAGGRLPELARRLRDWIVPH
jgi:hypothetical protein